MTEKRGDFSVCGLEMTGGGQDCGVPLSAGDGAARHFPQRGKLKGPSPLEKVAIGYAD